MSSLTLGHIDGIEVQINNPQSVDPRSSVLVFVHGMWGTHEVFWKWMYACQNEGRHACAVTLPANGRTRFSDYVKAVEKVVERLHSRSKNVVLVGHSMGGLVCQKAAELHPESVKSLVLLASAAPKGIFHASRMWFKPRYLLAALLGRQFPLDYDDAKMHVLNGLSISESRYTYGGFREESGRVLREIALGIPVGQICCPVLVVGADNDRLLPLAPVQARLAKRYGAPYWRCDTGHMIPLEDKGGVIRDVFGWVSNRCDPEVCYAAREV